MPKMRTIEQCVAHIRENDPGTALTEYALRRMVISGEVPSVKTGRKYLIDLDVLERFLRGEI